MAVIYVDNIPYEVPDGQSLLHACLSLGFDIPYFCWHPAMQSVGACRQCAVKQFRDENDKKGFIVMSCMTEALDGIRISIDDTEVKEFRASIIEFLMLNHPHDCPVCDEGGECHLQDMTLMTGHVHRRTRFKKRTYKNQDLGPFINHEHNRCIQCYRCVRFYRDFAGGRDLHVFGMHDRVYFGRSKDGTLENEFSGNLVEICPTGVFTDKTLGRHYTRKWDLQTAPSVCVHCSIGCNTIPGERYGSLRRIRNRYNFEVNWYFLCDRGRFGYEFVNNDHRIRSCFKNESNQSKPISPEEAIVQVAGILKYSKNTIGIGSPRASLESNFMLRELVGPDNFYSGVSEREHAIISLAFEILRKTPASIASLRDIRTSDTIFVLGEDPSNFAPMAAFYLRQAIKNKPMDIARQLKVPLFIDAAVRQSIQDDKGSLYLAFPFPTRIDDIATATFRTTPEKAALLAFAVAHHIDFQAPEVDGLSSQDNILARQIAESLTTSENPLIVSGTSLLNQNILKAAAQVAVALHMKGKNPKIAIFLSECNSMGLRLLDGKPPSNALDRIEREEVDTIIVLENDIYRRMEPEKADKLFRSAKNVIAIDHAKNKTTEIASFGFPGGTFADSDGTLINYEGRAQRFFQVIPPIDQVLDSRHWIQKIMVQMGRHEAKELTNLDEITKRISLSVPQCESLTKLTGSSDFRVHGMKIARQSHRYSGRTAMTADRTVHEPKPAQDTETPFSFSMEGFQGKPPSSLVPRFWAPRWNSIQSLNKFQSEVAGTLTWENETVGVFSDSREIDTEYKSIRVAQEKKQNELLLLPMNEIFGSEELSGNSQSVKERVPEPYILVSWVDAHKREIKDQDRIRVLVSDQVFESTARVREEIPAGICGLPVGLPENQFLDLPCFCTIQNIVLTANV